MFPKIWQSKLISSNFLLNNSIESQFLMDKSHIIPISHQIFHWKFSSSSNFWVAFPGASTVLSTKLGTSKDDVAWGPRVGLRSLRLGKSSKYGVSIEILEISLIIILYQQQHFLKITNINPAINHCLKSWWVHGLPAAPRWRFETLPRASYIMSLGTGFWWPGRPGRNWKNHYIIEITWPCSIDDHVLLALL